MKRNVLVVDDSLTVRMDLHEALSAAGLATMLCADLASARRVLVEERPDLILLDVLLPDGDGIGLLRELREDPTTARTPVMLLSSEADVRDRIRGMHTGADEYAGKPYDIAWVVARARDLATRGTAETRDRPRILLVDDSPTFRKAMGEALEAAGYEVQAAGTGEQALLLAPAVRPDAIVVDGQLPGIDGATVVRRIKVDTALRGTPCLMLTGSSDDPREELRVLEAGADAFLNKNAAPALILARLAALVRASGPASPPSVAPHPSLLAPKRILVVDDSPTYLNALASELRDEGYDVVLARSAEEALDLLKVQDVDGILLDIVLPGISGHEMARRIKKSPEWREIPLVAIATRDDPATMIEAVNAGADDFVVKSPDFSVVRARLRAQLRRRHLEDEARRAGLEAAEARSTKALAETRAALIADLERKNAELESAREEAERARRLAQAESLFKSRFLAGMSHELRTPLNAILGFSELLEQELFGPLNPLQQEYVGNVLTSGRHLLTLVNDILDLSKVEAGRMTLAREWVDLAPMAESVLAVLRPLADKKDLRVEIEVPAGLPGMFVDPVRFKQVLFNLLSNALKFTPTGGHILLSAGRSDTEILVAVRDSGIGIRPEDLGRLFREFERIEPAKGEVPEGTGLGLALTRRLVELHGGRIEVRSRVGEGSTFTVAIPLAGPADAGT